MTVRNLLHTLAAALCLLAAAIIFAPSRAEAQETCISCPPGEGPPQTPPGVSISPGTGTITGEAAGKTETVVIDVCSPVPMGTGSILIRLNGVDVTSRFSTGPSGEPYTDPGCATHYRSTGTVVLTPGTHALTAQATNIHGTGSDQANLSYRVTTWGILVGPDDAEAGVAPGAAGSQVFTVINTGNVTATYNIAAHCGPPITASCSANTSQVTLGAGASAPVTLSYTGGTAGANGPVRLRATRAGTTDSWDEGSVQLNVANPSGSQVAPVLTVSEGSPGATPTPSLCLTMPAGPAADYQCGDLRIGHAFPGVRTLNQSRAPTLVYNSGHASPMLVGAANVRLPAGGATPDSVTALLSIPGQPVERRRYAGAEWNSDRNRRILVGKLATGLQTGLYSYTLDVTFWYGATPKTSTLAWSTPLVNRIWQAFGGGWWIAGLERIEPGTQTIRWTGGDGAMRIYQLVATDTWVAPTVSHPDTIRKVGVEYVRHLPGGERVLFDGQGRHKASVDLVGRRSQFIYEGTSGKLTSIRVPTGMNTGTSLESHRLNYDAQGRLYEVLSFDSAGSWTANPRRTTLTYGFADQRVTRITDPDGTFVTFTYDGQRIASRTDRRGNATTWTYDGAGLLAQASTSLGAGEVPSVTRWKAAESLGWTTSAYARYTLIDGPRTDAPDQSRVWINRFGAPLILQDAFGRNTTIAYDAAFPALPSRMAAVSGQVSASTYNARGNVVETTDSSTWRTLSNGTRKYATTRYLYEDTAFPDFPTLVVPPEGDSTRIAYRTDGLRWWMRDARGGDSTKVLFTYDDATYQVQTVRTWKQHTAPVQRVDSLFYDAMGNLERQKTAEGVQTRYRHDALGRMVRTLPPQPADQLNADSAYTAVSYDRMDRVLLTQSHGPEVRFNNGVALTSQSTVLAQTVTVRTYFNAEGHPDSVVRTVSPDPAPVGRMATRWVYDAAGRAVREIAGDGAVEHRSYDPAGNRTSTLTRRGLVVSSWYDRMNRLVRSVTPEVSYPKTNFVVDGSTWVYPLFQAQPGEPGAFGSTFNSTGGVVIPGDESVFAYDTVGRLIRADNREAKIRRTWNPNGTLATETQKIRTYLGADTTAHVYTLAYAYDLNGRRTSVTHPTNLAPTGTNATGTTAYAYAPHGALSTVVDALSGTYRFYYDGEGNLARRTGSTYESYQYDADGRTVQRVHDDGSRTFHHDVIGYDATGKPRDVTSTLFPNETITSNIRYTGLGMMANSITDHSVSAERAIEMYGLDGLGNRVRQENYSHDFIKGQSSSSLTLFTYQQGTGRLLKRVDSGGEGRNGYDASGNQVEEMTLRNMTTPYTVAGISPATALLQQYTLSYYDAAERLRVVDRRGCLLFTASLDCDLTKNLPYDARSAFDEYRYDALGRRVLTRTRASVACPNATCMKAVIRTVWDGDQILYEISAPGGATDATMESDNFPPPTVPTYGGGGFYGYGRVAYAHGAGIDAPVSLIRMGYSSLFPEPVRVEPFVNWSGKYDGGTGRWCTDIDGSGGSTQIAENVRSPGEPQDMIVTPTGGAIQHCVEVDWPAQAMYNTYERRDHKRRTWEGPVSWMGSLVQHGRDASGQYYRRNRYYDASSGRFTQEDPIGLAGGANLYGYANGDPINYSDPYGLDAIYIRFNFYPIAVGPMRLPLFHSAVISVDADGRTRYYEYGRYDSERRGIARQREVPNLVMKDGKPTQESLDNLYAFVSERYGKGRGVHAEYDDEASAEGVNNYAEGRIRQNDDPNRKSYSLRNNNCRTFAREAIQAGKEEEEEP